MVKYYRKKYTKEITKEIEEPSVKLQMHCHKHGEIIGYTKSSNPIIYERLNESKTEVELKCYKCLEDKFQEEEKEASLKVSEKFGTGNIEYNIGKGDPYNYEMASAITMVIGVISSLYIYNNFNFKYAIINVILFGIIAFSLWARGYYLENKEKENRAKRDEISTYRRQYSNSSPKFTVEYNAKIVLEWRKNQAQIKIEKMNYSFEEIDTMTGLQFEYFVKRLLQKSGYEKVEITKASGDEGVDLTAIKNGKKIAFQCKRYKNKITNKAIQEVFSGKHFYKCDEAYVITNSYFTDNAILLAKNHKVKLINRDQLFDLLEKANESSYQNKTEIQQEFNF